MDGLILEPCENACEDSKDVGLVLASEAENNEAGELGRRVGADVGEASVEANEDSPLLKCCGGHPLICGASEAFLKGR